MDDQQNNRMKDIISQIRSDLNKANRKKGNKYHPSDSQYFDYLKLKLGDIGDPEIRNMLKNWAEYIHGLQQQDYSQESSYKLLEIYRNLSIELDRQLLPEIQDRFERIIKKEVKYLKMQEPDNNDLWEIGDETIANVAIQQPIHGDVGEQEKIINGYILELLDYRLSTLSDETAWDFLAQSILNYSTREL